MRPDIQALRALAVLSVVIFHLWPSALPGGYVGVDIFFVISGFLITGQLWRQVERDGKVNFTDFWARRARRLLPASLFVILATMVVAFVYIPKGQLAKFVGDAVGSAFYVANWQLIAKSTNYLEDTASPSPFQHFWSLSVEEQYYIVWPIILFIAIFAAKLVRLRPKWGVLAALVAIAGLSLIYSIKLTDYNAAKAYFSTFTRAWEFAFGALLAVALSKNLHKALNPLVYWAGAATLVYTLMTFTTATPFPSYWAAIPVIGTTLLLASGDQKSRLIPTKLLSLPPIQFLGNISYSLYLWHWPVMILVPWIVPGRWSLPRAAISFAIAIVLATLSKYFIEDPVRFGPLARLRAGWQIAITSALVVAVAAGSFALSEFKPITPNSASGTNHIYRVENPKKSETPPHCLASKTSADLNHCVAGVANGHIHVAVIGDSHSRQYWLVLEEMAQKYDWQLTLISKSACPLQDSATYAVPLTHSSCKKWNVKLGDYLKQTAPFDLIINSNASFYTDGNAAVSASYRKLVETQTSRGEFWLLIKDNPKPMKDIAACLVSARGNAAEDCAVPRGDALSPKDALPEAIKGLPSTAVVDPTDLFCDDFCKPVIDNQLQYRDFSHLSWRASQRVAPLIEAAVPARLK